MTEAIAVYLRLRHTETSLTQEKLSLMQNFINYMIKAVRSDYENFSNLLNNSTFDKIIQEEILSKVED